MFNKTLICAISAILIGFLSGCISMSEKKNVKMGNAEFTVDVTFYKADSKSKKSILIVPPTGGTNYIDRSYAEEFQRLGFDVYILNRWTGDDEKRIDLDIHQYFYTRAQEAIGVVLDQIKTPFIGLMGTSVGALHASVAASRYDRLNAVFVITGGVSIPEVIVTSDQGAMKEVKKMRMEKYGFKNDDEYLEALRKEFHLDPLDLGDKYKNKTLGMVIGTQDTTVMTKTQRQLQKFWNPKTTIVFENNHFWTIVKTWLFESRAVFHFFEKDAASARYN